MPQKSLIWCWIPSTKSLIATGGSLNPFKASDEIRESHSKIISHTAIPPISYAKLTLVSIALALHFKGPRTRNLRAHCCQCHYTTVAVPDVCSNPRWVSSSKCGPWQLYLNFIVLNLIFSLDQENKWSQVKLKNYNALPY